MILTELKNHPVAYFLLLLSTIVFVWLFFHVWPDTTTERVLILTFGFWYFIWGVLTHRGNGILSREVTKEYGLVAILGVVLLLMVTF